MDVPIGDPDVCSEKAKPSTATENRTPLRATNKALYKGNQTSKPLNFQASNCPCTPGTSATCQQARRNDKHAPAGDTGDAGDAGAPRWGDGGDDGVWGGAPPRTPISESANQPISEALHGAPRDAGAPGKRAADEDFRRPTRRETEGGGRGQRRSRRATDGARSGSRPLLRLCGKAPPFSGRLCRPTHLSTISTEL